MNINEKLCGKRLLLLGDSVSTQDMIQYAQNHDVYVIITDHLPPEISISKKLANEYWDVSTADIDRLEQLVKQNNIDGIFAGVSEFNLEKAKLLCNRCHLPFYALDHQWEIATNKAKFKKLCQEFDISTPENISFYFEEFSKHNDQSIFPVVVKPVDSRAGMGVFICNDLEELSNNYQRSITFSKSKRVLLEPFISSKQVNIYYAIQNGEISLISIADRHVKNQHDGNLPLPVAFIMPSTHLHNYVETLDEKVKKMIKSIGIQNGVLLIQSFVDNDSFTFYEMGFRLNGSMEYKITTKLNNINSLEMMINYALTGVMYDTPIKEFVDPNYSNWGCILFFVAKPGKIGKIVGIDRIRSLQEIIDIVPTYHEGDLIHASFGGTLRQVILKVFISTNTKAKLVNVINQVQTMIEVYDINGENMLLSGVEAEDLLQDK
jgi:carbamoylphosphate synthase large subunit